MTNSNLLVISNLFPDKNDYYSGGIFIKENLRFMKKNFDKIYVISPRPIGYDFLKKQKHDDYSYEDNIEVIFPKYFYMPGAYRKKRVDIIQKEYELIRSIINDSKFSFNLIHAHFTWRAGAVAAKLKDDFNVPLIITEHSSKTFKTAIESRDPIFINAWNKADRIIRVRKQDIHLFVNAGIERNKIRYVPNGFDDEKFHNINKIDCRKRLSLPEDKKIILTIGSLDKIKGQEFLITAMRILSLKYKNLLCLIIGDGPLKRKLMKMAHYYSLDNVVKLVGPKPHNEIPIWINAADLFVFPSLMESFGIVQIEAMACGKPVIATRNGGSEEIIVSEDYGLLCEPANSKDLTEKILIALNTKWSCQSIAEYARQFTWKKISNQVMKIYQEVL